MKIYEKIHPEKIYAIDITGPHIEFARRHFNELNLSDKIHFEKMDACRMCYQPCSFDYVIGIEGPAHFNTRETFLRKAYEVLKPGGVMLLSDIIIDIREMLNGFYNRRIGKLCAKHWFMPEANWMSIDELKVLMEKIGFKIDVVERIGDKVYPGFAEFNLKWVSLKNAVKTRGFRIGVALSFISWLLGHVHRRKMIDYVFIRALKN